MTTKRNNKTAVLDVNDVFDELSDENNRLKQILDILIDFKQFCDSIVSQLNSYDIERYKDLEQKLKQLKDKDLNDVLHWSKIKDKSEERLERIKRYHDLYRRLDKTSDNKRNTVVSSRPKKKVENKRNVVKKNRVSDPNEFGFKKRKMTVISNETREEMIKMIENGARVSDVSKMYNYDWSTVYKIHLKYQRTGITYKEPRGHMRKVFTEEQAAMVRQWYKNEPSLTMTDLKEKCIQNWPNIAIINNDMIQRCFTDAIKIPEQQLTDPGQSQPNTEDTNYNTDTESSMAAQSIGRSIDNNGSIDEETIEQWLKSNNENPTVKEECLDQRSNEELSNDNQNIETEDNYNLNDNSIDSQQLSQSDSDYSYNDKTNEKTTKKSRIPKNKNKVLSDEMRHMIVKMIESGMQFRQVARTFGRNESTVYKFYRTYKRTGRINKKKTGQGRHKTLSDEQIQHLEEWYKEDPSLTQAELKDRLLKKWPDVKVCCTTISRYLQDAYQTVKKVKKVKQVVVEEGPFFCPNETCRKEFNTKILLRMHMKCHNNINTYSCVRCPYTTKTRHCLSVHVLNMHGQNRHIRPFKCHYDGCSKDFRSKYALKSHIASRHAPPDTVVCDVEGCGRVLKNQRLLKTHKNVYHGEAKYCCEWPGCDFKTKHDKYLIKHRLVHTDECKFVCTRSTCGKKFKTKKYLEEHERMHNNDRRYKCSWPGCQYTCIFGGNLNKHMRVHQK